MRRAAVAWVLLLSLASIPAPLSEPASGQGLGTDLVLEQLSVGNATFEDGEATPVTATVLNNGSRSASGVLHFRYNDTDTALTGDSRSDQPFNTTDPLEPGERVNLTIVWEPSQDQIGPGQVIVYLTSASDSTPGNNQASTGVFVECYRFGLDWIDTTEHDTLPGRFTGYRLAVQNTGNAPSTPKLSIAQPAPPGWQVDLPPMDTVLAPGERDVALVLVAPPSREADELPDGSNASATVEVHALENPQANRTTRPPNTTVQRERVDGYAYGISLQAEDQPVAVHPLAPAHVPLTVENTGNVFDVFNLSSTVSGRLAGNLTVTFPDSLLVLGPGEASTVTALVHLDGDPPTHLGAELTVQAASINDRFEPDATDEVTREVRIAAPDLRTASIDPPVPVYRAQARSSVSITVENAGQGPAPSTNLTVQALRGGFPFAERTVRAPVIPSGATQTVSVGLPVSNLSGSYDLRVHVDADDRVDESREDNNVAEGELFVRTASLSLSAADGIQALPGQFIRYERPPHVFTVRNQGNAPERVDVHVRSQHGWIDEEHTLNLPSGARGSIPFSLVIPDRPGTETDRITVTATLANRTVTTVSGTTTTEVIDREPPVLVDAQLPRNVTATQPFPVRTEWSDAIGVRSVHVELTAPEGAGTRTVNLTRQSPGVFGGNATVFELGAYEVRFVAVDASSHANTFASQDALTLDATYTRHPTITFTDPADERVVRAGSPIPVEIDAPAGLARVTYEGGGQQGTLSAPFQVPTDGWAPGEQRVTVTASNRYGLEASASATYEVDNEPPAIEDVRTEPDDPEPDQTFRLVVETSGAATGGTVRVEDDGGQRVTERNLTGSNGVLATRLTVPAGAHEALVSVHDAAGNEATRSVSIDAGTSAIPAAGSLVHLLALAAVAVSIRSSRLAGSTARSGTDPGGREQEGRDRAGGPEHAQRSGELDA